MLTLADGSCGTEAEAPLADPCPCPLPFASVCYCWKRRYASSYPSRHWKPAPDNFLLVPAFGFGSTFTMRSFWCLNKRWNSVSYSAFFKLFHKPAT